MRIVGIGLLSLSAAGVLAAESVPVRGGEHANYSRLVFDFSEQVPYKISKNADGSFSLTFSSAYQLDMAKLNVSALSRVAEVREVSFDPLVVRVTPKGAMAMKDFRLGQRLVVDFKPLPLKAAEDRPVVAVADKKAPSQKSLSKVRRVTAPEKTVEAAAAQPVDTMDEAKAKPSPKKANFQLSALARRMKEALPFTLSSKRPSYVSVSSISPIHMAGFVLHDSLWLVNSDEMAVIEPRIKGDIRKVKPKLENVKNADANIFHMTPLSGVDYMVQGGGLAWRFMIGQDIHRAHKPAQIQITDVGVNTDRGGEVFIPLGDVGEVVRLTDPDTGYDVFAVTVASASSYVGRPYEFLDFSILPSPLGLAVLAKSEGVVVEPVNGGVIIGRDGGRSLSLSAQIYHDRAIEWAKKKAAKKEEKEKPGQKKEVQLFDFKGWRLGEAKDAQRNKALMLASLPSLNRDGQVQVLMDLARMYIANAMGYEALGFLDLAGSALPDLKANPAFLSLRGLALALSGRHADAFQALSHKLIKDKEEILYWRSFSVANLGDWQQAVELLPKDLTSLKTYTTDVSIPLALTLTEVSLRSGDAKRSKMLLDFLKEHAIDGHLRLHQQAAYEYLKGEHARQQGEIKDAIKYWANLYEGADDLYRVRGGLALTFLELKEDSISLEDAIDRLERLRYAWRGDDLEAQVNYKLGKLYFDNGAYVKGLNIMRDSASYAKSTHLGQRIAQDMSDAFSEIYLGRKLYELSGPEVAALYEHYSELVPTGEKGSLLSLRLADRLVQAHLYDRAIEILTYQLDNRISGRQAYDVAARLAVVHLFNGAPDQSLEVLDRAEALAQGLKPVERYGIDAEIAMLRARTLASLEQPEAALALLRSTWASTGMHKLRSEIAWEHGYWDDAAEALRLILEGRDDLHQAPISEELANMLVQRAVALNLGGDRVSLAYMRKTYGDVMANTGRARAFDVVTRSHQSAALADRDTLLNIVSEIEIFDSFLETYRDKIDEDIAKSKAEAEAESPEEGV